MIANCLIKRWSSTWSKISPSPIQTFSVEDFNVCKEKFLKEQGPLFHSFPYDLYDMRREQIEFLVKSLPKSFLESQEEVLKDHFLGIGNSEKIRSFVDQLPKEQQEKFSAIKPFRQRAVSQFHLEKTSDGWQIHRTPMLDFSQQNAQQQQTAIKDWRLLPRIFSPLNEADASLPLFRQVLCGVSDLVMATRKCNALSIVVHHVKVTTRRDCIRGNSPEGIHQDGYPFLVTALVVERKGVEGGKSLIFDEDKETTIFNTTLREGQGLLQADSNTHLWHSVTPITPLEGEDEGYRSSIGFDIDVI